jgi:TetR/AcrR family transcriptional regulator, transcriptional repressor for nem operon
MLAMNTAQRILDVAERLVQTQGFNGFSYADISAQLRVTKASLHYHFATKADLGSALVARYSAGFRRALETIDESAADAREKLRRYADLYAEVLRRDRMCLCGMLAADYTTLPTAMRAGVKDFFDLNESWLARVFEEGRKQRLLHFRGTPLDAARLLLGSLEGAMLVARSYGQPERFTSAAQRLLADLCSAPRPPANGARRLSR